MNCAFCGGELSLVLDCGYVALAGGFLQPQDFEHEERYPLQLCRCEGCLAVQLDNQVDPEVLFRNYFYLSAATATVSEHFRGVADMLVRRFAPKTVFEIGSNDGVLLQHFVGKVDRAVGIEPASVPNLAQGAVMVREFWGAQTARSMVDAFGHPDLIVANNVFAHISDINGATAAVRDSLSERGVFVFEVQHLGAMLERCQYDWIYHEHLYYHSLLALEIHLGKHGLKVFDVEPVALHGGSMRFYACKDARVAAPAVAELRATELRQGLDQADTFRRFATRVLDHRRALMGIVNRLDRERAVIAGYGASGRANALMQFCGIGAKHLAYVVDDAPAKQGFYTPGTHIPILPRQALEDSPPDYVLLFAWNYADEIMPKLAGHRVIVPLPKAEILKERLAA